MSNSQESKRSPVTARAFLVRLLNSLGDGIVESSVVAGDMALATIKASDGNEYNISIHKLKDTGMTARGPKPKLK